MKEHRVLAASAVAFALFFFWLMYASMYNEAMTACMKHHSVDVCVETLK